VDIKAKLTTSSTYGARVFVSCQDSDTVVPIEYNSGAGALALDSFLVDTELSTDSTAITNATLGNTTTYTTYPCGNTGSCPLLLDLMPNPALHFTTGGYAPTLPFALASATNGSGYSVNLTVQGGAVPLTWSNPDGLLGTGACAGLSIDSYGRITGTPSTTGTCGFIIRVADGSGQFVERAFSITVN
jgi:hypothetical protein